MIGVLAKPSDEEVVREFFELFKTPWEPYRDGHPYDVIINTTDETISADSRLTVIYATKDSQFKDRHKTDVLSKDAPATLECNGANLPIYNKLLIFQEADRPLITVEGVVGAVGIETGTDDKKVLCIGYDIFEEIRSLLSCGQPVKHAHSPTIDIHAAWLRDWIIGAGLHLIEIPPVPSGYNFITCITHDVDFLGIRNHKFDHTFFGFIFRATVVSISKAVRSQIPFSRLLRNLGSLILLPGIYLGLFRDFWFQLERYMKLEKGLASTYYFIPIKGHRGDIDPEQTQPLAVRSSKYNIIDFKNSIENLLDNGFEVGLHGIDAWHDATKAQHELQVIRQLTGDADLGVRMHWLYFSEESPTILKRAGFLYDSTLGYNETVGYRSGTTQVFKPFGESSVYELPLNIMDTALFYRNRLSLNEGDALRLCNNLIQKSTKYGGVFTINWHQRSLAPERCWDTFYQNLLTKLKSSNTWFATARDAVKWFATRRSVKFGKATCSEKALKIYLSATSFNNHPGLIIRVYHPKSNSTSRSIESFTDINWNGASEVEYTF